jgi:hypothetical protein
LHTKKTIDKVGGWDESIRRYGDFDLGCRLARLGARGIGVDEIITNCYSDQNQMTNDPERHNLDARDLINNKIQQKWLKY